MESEASTDPIVLDMEQRQYILGPKRDWLILVDPLLRKELQTSKFRKYRGQKLRDLLRVIRNKTHHYRDLPVPMQQQLGSLPDGFLQYWSSRFPLLLIETFRVIQRHCATEENFRQFFC